LLDCLIMHPQQLLFEVSIMRLIENQGIVAFSMASSLEHIIRLDLRYLSLNSLEFLPHSQKGHN